MNRNLLFAFAAAALLLAPAAQATLIDHHAAATDGADRLLEVQFENGVFPWVVDAPYCTATEPCQNVQGITAMGLLDAYTVTLDEAYLDGAGATFDWLADYHNADEENLLSSANYFFMAKYGLLQLEMLGDGEAVDTAREAFDRLMEARDGPAAYAETIIQARANQGHTNLGLWDVGLFVRAAQDIGYTEAADEMAEVLATQTIVDPFDENANWYEIGLSGIVFGLSEADLLAHQGMVTDAKDALLATQAEDGSFPATFGGEAFPGDIQTTAFAAYALTHALDLAPAAQAACDFLAASQAENGGWDLGGYEIAEVNGEAVSALVSCILPVHNGATSYANGDVPGI